MQLEMFKDSSEGRLRELEKTVYNLKNQVSILKALLEMDSNIRNNKGSRNVYHMDIEEMVKN